MSNVEERERQRYALLWGGQQVGSRGRKPSLKLRKIVKAGLSIADKEGLSEVSMNRVAKKVGLAVMGLYRYIPSKDALIDLMVESVLGEIPYPDPAPRGWRARLAVSAYREWQMYGRHPWVLQAVSTTRLPMGPNMVRDLNWMLESVEELSDEAETRLWLTMLLMAYVQGAGLVLISEREAARKKDSSIKEFWDAKMPALGKGAEGFGASAVVRLFSKMTRPVDLDTWFEFGLQRTLDGIKEFAAHK